MPTRNDKKEKNLFVVKLPILQTLSKYLFFRKNCFVCLSAYFTSLQNSLKSRYFGLYHRLAFLVTFFAMKKSNTIGSFGEGTTLCEEYGFTKTLDGSLFLEP